MALNRSLVLGLVVGEFEIVCLKKGFATLRCNKCGEIRVVSKRKARMLKYGKNAVACYSCREIKKSVKCEEKNKMKLSKKTTLQIANELAQKKLEELLMKNVCAFKQREK